MSLYKFGRYEIINRINKGGMAAVFHAYDPRFKRDVALKVLPPEYTNNSNFRARFKREAQTIASLEHPAIVPVYDFGEEGDLLYMVMRYLTGGTLEDRVKESGPFSVKQVAQLIEQLAPALTTVHEQGIIHRDLKPTNILFDQFDNPFITDFGIVKITKAEEALTVTGEIIGTPSYMSPEQAMGSPNIDGRCDVYALGVIMFQMLTGQLPFQSDTPVGVALKHISDPIPNILDVNPNLPSGCQVIINLALAKEPDNRYSTAIGLATALTELSNTGAEQAAPVTQPEIEPPQPVADPAATVTSKTQGQSKERVVRLIQEFTDPANYVAAESELIEMGNDAIVSLLDLLLNASETDTRNQAANILKLLFEQAHISPLNKARALKALGTSLTDPEVSVRYCSLKALSVFDGAHAQRAVESIGTLLDDPDDFIREQAEQTLKQIGGKYARSLLNQYKKGQ